MRDYLPGDAVECRFNTTGSTGAAADADALPTGTLLRNGVADATPTVTVTDRGTGRYSAAFTIPVGYAAGDLVELEVAATVGGVAGAAVVWRAPLGPDRSAASASTSAGTAATQATTAATQATTAATQATAAASSAAAVQAKLPGGAQDIAGGTDLDSVLSAATAAATEASGANGSAQAAAAYAGDAATLAAAIKERTDNLPDDPASEATAAAAQSAAASAASAAGTAATEATAAAAEAASAASAAGSAETAATSAATSASAVAAVLSGITSLAQWLRAAFRSSAPDATALSEINLGGGSFDPTAHSLQAVRAKVNTIEGGGGGGGSPGDGPYAIAVTVEDEDGAALEGAIVRFEEGVDAFSQTTDADGEATFGLYGVTYTAMAYKAGYQHTPEEFTPSESGPLTLTLTRVAYSAPASPSRTTAYGVVYDGKGAPKEGARVYFRLADTSGGSAGEVYLRRAFSETSGEDGTFSLPLLKARAYEARVDGGQWSAPFTTGSGDTYPIPVLFGAKE